MSKQIKRPGGAATGALDHLGELSIDAPNVCSAETVVNRPNRRMRRAMRKSGTNAGDIYRDYVRHLPRAPIGTLLKRLGLFHGVLFHDDWCAQFRGAPCDCEPWFHVHEEPRRS